MTRIDTVSKYRCDGCGNEQQNPYGWFTVIPMMVGAFNLILGNTGAGHSVDYCPGCMDKMRDAMKPKTVNIASDDNLDRALDAVEKL